MPHSTRRRLYLIFASSFFVTAVLLAYSSENDVQKRRLHNEDAHVWYYKQMGDIRNLNNHNGNEAAVNASLTLGGGGTNHEVKVVSSNSSSRLTVISKSTTDTTKGHKDIQGIVASGSEPKTQREEGLGSSRMEERRQLVRTVCSARTDTTFEPPSVKDVLYNPKYKFYYCPVEKVASTFWRRFIYQLHHTDPVKSPFDVPIMRALRGMRDDHLPPQSMSGTGLSSVLNESTKLLFVRDPHSRIFSAYVDKLLAPNPYYWKVWALPAIMRYRDNHHNVRGHSHCGHDVKFEEFVKYVINVAANADGHVMPINRMCTPCAVSYSVIGKMETFSDDINMLFDALHLDKTPLRMSTMKQETTVDAIADSATDALSGSWLATSLRCISKEAVLQRIWRKSQIRGFISWRKNLKLQPLEIRRMKSPEFIKLLNEASKLSTDKNELKIQKLQALKEAYSTIDSSLLSSIVKIYGDDLKLFDYPETPSWLQDIRSENFIDTKAFDYSKDWDLSSVINSANL